MLVVMLGALACSRRRALGSGALGGRPPEASTGPTAVRATPATRTPSRRLEEPPPAEPRQEYVRLCAPCHGPEGRGYAADHAPSLVNPTFLESATDDFLRRSIASGRPGTSMGAYGKVYGGPLDDNAMGGLVAFLRRQGPAARSLKAPAAGSPTRGEAIYVRVCKSCHGDATTRGEAVHLANSQFLRQASDAFINHAVVNGRPGTKMLAFSGTLTRAQIADVVAFVRGFEKTQTGVDLLPPPTGHEPLVLNPRGPDPVFTVRDDRFVGVDQVNQALAARRRLIVIDARPPSDWMRVHVTGAVSIPYHDLTRLQEIPDDVWVVAYCACPHHLSGEVVDALIKRGHQRALILDEGINEWHRRGFPVKAARGVTVPVQEAPAAPLPSPGPLVPTPGQTRGHPHGPTQLPNAGPGPPRPSPGQPPPAERVP